MNIVNSNPNFYHTKFPVLADVLIETMQENISATRGLWWWWNPEAKRAECDRSITMIAIVDFLRQGLLNIEQGPIRPEQKALLWLGLAAVKHMGQSIEDRLLRKMIQLSTYNGSYGAFFTIDRTLGNKVFQDEPPNYPMCNELQWLVFDNSDRKIAVLKLFAADLKKCKLEESERNKGLLEGLLHHSQYVEVLKAPIILGGIRRFRKQSSFGKLGKDVSGIILKMVIGGLKTELYDRMEIIHVVEDAVLNNERLQEL